MENIKALIKEKNSENHPYIDYCRKIANIIRPHALYLEMCDMLKENEESLEEDIGYELEPVDFLNGNAILQSIKDNETVPPSFDDDEYRRDKLKSIYKKLKQEKDFSGGSQWFYIYKMMAENLIYEEHSYTLFIQDLTMIGVPKKQLPAENIFARKYKQIQSKSRYPHWQVMPGKKQTTLTIGKKLAGIAFKVLFP